MGDTIWVDVQGRAKGECPRDNSIILRLRNQLDRLCHKLKVPQLSRFYDYSELEGQLFRPIAMFLGWIREVIVFGGVRPKEMWYDPGPAIAAVKALHSHLALHPGDLGFSEEELKLGHMKFLMEELEHCGLVLENAQSSGHKFRFLIVP